MPRPHPDPTLFAHLCFASRSLELESIDPRHKGRVRKALRVCEANNVGHVEHESQNDNGDEAIMWTVRWLEQVERDGTHANPNFRRETIKSAAQRRGNT